MQKYDLASLVRTFTEHAAAFDEQNEKDKAAHPEWECWKKPDFSLPRALAVICSHIQTLYAHVELLQDKKDD